MENKKERSRESIGGFVQAIFFALGLAAIYMGGSFLLELFGAIENSDEVIVIDHFYLRALFAAPFFFSPVFLYSKYISKGLPYNKNLYLAVGIVFLVGVGFGPTNLSSYIGDKYLKNNYELCETRKRTKKPIQEYWMQKSISCDPVRLTQEKNKRS